MASQTPTTPSQSRLGAGLSAANTPQLAGTRRSPRLNPGLESSPAGHLEPDSQLTRQPDGAPPHKKICSSSVSQAASLPLDEQFLPGSAEEFEKRGKCFIFKGRYENAFMNWFQRQRFACSQGLKKDLDKAIKWGGPGRQAAAWHFFEEGADRQDGSPRAVCIRCDACVAHPGLHGTKAMNSHLDTATCNRIGAARGISKEAVQARLQEKVMQST